jgi:hypothetical protein
MIGKCHGRGTPLGCLTAQPIDPAGAVEERIFGVDVQMDELVQAGFLKK